jgi:hypothetical protein
MQHIVGRSCRHNSSLHCFGVNMCHCGLNGVVDGFTQKDPQMFEFLSVVAIPRRGTVRTIVICGLF